MILFVLKLIILTEFHILNVINNHIKKIEKILFDIYIIYLSLCG